MQRPIDNQKDWDARGATAAFFPLEQAFAYGQALAALGQRVDRIATQAGAAQLFTRRLFGLWQLTQSLRGPFFPEGAEPTAPLREILAACPRGFPRIRLLMPELTGESHAAIAAAGMRRVLTGYHTLLLDLRPGAEAIRKGMEGRWRNRLVAAEGEGLRVEFSKGGRPFDWLMRKNAGMAKERGVQLPKPILVTALAAAAGPPRTLLVSVLEKNEPLAAGLFLRHGPDATYYVSHTTLAGRDRSATNLMLWAAIRRLSDQGVRHLDLGGIDTRDAPGLARFKLGLGGRVLSLAGTYAR